MWTLCYHQKQSTAADRTEHPTNFQMVKTWSLAIDCIVPECAVSLTSMVGQHQWHSSYCKLGRVGPDGIWIPSDTEKTM